MPCPDEVLLRVKGFRMTNTERAGTLGYHETSKVGLFFMGIAYQEHTNISKNQVEITSTNMLTIKKSHIYFGGILRGCVTLRDHVEPVH